MAKTIITVATTGAWPTKENKSSMEILYGAVALGGHIRVGMEDNVLYSRGVLAESNAQLVARAARVIREYGNEPATPDEASAILSLK